MKAAKLHHRPDRIKRVKGGAGDVILFHNEGADGGPNPLSEHAGLPITSGQNISRPDGSGIALIQRSADALALNRAIAADAEANSRRAARA